MYFLLFKIAIHLFSKNWLKTMNGSSSLCQMPTVLTDKMRRLNVQCLLSPALWIIWCRACMIKLEIKKSNNRWIFRSPCLPCYLRKCWYPVYWNILYPLSILKVIFLKSNPLRFRKTLMSFNNKQQRRHWKGDPTGTVLWEMVTKLFVWSNFQQNKLLIYLFNVSVT